jgi:ABC-type multidrug transport system permease subunit
MKLAASIITLIGAILLLIVGIITIKVMPAMWLNGITFIILGIGLILLSITEFGEKDKKKVE